MVAVVCVRAWPQGVWSALTPELYTLFWTLTVHDLYVPTAAYESELTKVRPTSHAHPPHTRTRVWGPHGLEISGGDVRLHLCLRMARVPMRCERT